MSLTALKIQALRLFSQVQFSCHPTMNIICGANGRGKTTFLEAIYLLTSGRSFRTKDTAALIAEGYSSCHLWGEMDDHTNIVLQKSLHEPMSLKLNGQACLSTSELVRMYPSQVIYQDIFQIMDAGPSVRRSLLDWGVFHVKHSYLELIKQYRKVLKHRNALLKEGVHDRYFVPWDSQLVVLAKQITSMRQDYLKMLNESFVQTLSQISDFACHLVFDKGWGKGATQRDQSLLDILLAALPQDRQYRYTRYGPHHADILFETSEHKIKHYLSRGQQKILLFSLKIAQAKILNQPCIFLIDDIYAELDDEHLQRVLEVLKKLPGQFFITCHDAEKLIRYLKKEAAQVIAL